MYIWPCFNSKSASLHEKGKRRRTVSPKTCTFSPKVYRTKCPTSPPRSASVSTPSGPGVPSRPASLLAGIPTLPHLLPYPQVCDR